MRSVIQPDSQKRRPTFIEEARRRQIVQTAIRTIATRGFSQASLAEIARKAGISKGVISYHFDGKEALVEEILASLLREPADFVKARVDRENRPLAQLRAYVEANFEFMRTHRDHYVALVDLWGRRPDAASGGNRFDADAYEPSRHYLARILESGIEQGEIRDVPLRTTASLIQAAIDGVMLQWVLDEDALDLDAAISEVTDMITGHVRPFNSEAAS